MGTTRTAITASLLALLLAACGDGLKGSFEQEGGVVLTFDGRGKVVQSMEVEGIKVEGTYEVDGDTVRLLNPALGTMVLTRKGRDTLVGDDGFVGSFTRRK